MSHKLVVHPILPEVSTTEQLIDEVVEICWDAGVTKEIVETLYERDLFPRQECEELGGIVSDVLREVLPEIRDRLIATLNDRITFES